VRFSAQLPVGKCAIDVDPLSVVTVPGCGVYAQGSFPAHYLEVDKFKTDSSGDKSRNLVRIGSPEWIQQYDESAGGWKVPSNNQLRASVLVHCPRLGGVVAGIQLEDEIRGSARSIGQLRTIVSKIAVLSGDEQAAVDKAALRMGICEQRGDIVLGGLHPADKVKALEPLGFSRGIRVCAVGDGVNDGPLLAAAQLGIAMGRPQTTKVVGVASASADVLIPSGSISLVYEALAIAARCRFVSHLALLWAGSYNFVVLLVTSGCLAWFGVFLPAHRAALAMAGSSCFVILLSIILAWNLEYRRRKLRDQQRTLCSATEPSARPTYGTS
jgi:cation transport ATPase